MTDVYEVSDMADEFKPAENLKKLEENIDATVSSSKETIEDDKLEDKNNSFNKSIEFIDCTEETPVKKNFELAETSPEVSTSSNTSRYGRARKPKITEDYYNIEDIFGPYERITSSSPRRKSQKSDNSPKKVESIDLKPIEIKSVDINSILSINIPEVNVDMSKVIKIVSNNDFSPKSPNFSSKPIKTYGNKKKILESHEYKFINGAKFENSDNNVSKSIPIFSDESLSNDSLETPLKKRTKEYVKKSVSVSEDKNDSLDTSIFKKNKKLKKLQKELNIGGFKEGRLRSSVAESSEAEEEEKEVQIIEVPKEKKEVVLIEDNEENIEYLEGQSAYAPKIGDLSWSRVGSYPFWPSIVTGEPVTNRHSKLIVFGRRNVLCYHVHFFGDNGRRSWVYGTHIFPFNRRSDLEIMAQNVSKDSKPKDPKHLSAFIINPNKLKKWETAVTEAENLTQHARETRIKKFFEMVRPKIKKSLSPDKKSKLDMKIKIKKYKKKLKMNKKLETKDIKTEIKEEVSSVKDDSDKEKKRIKSDDSKTISDDSFSESDIPVTVKQERDTPSPQPESAFQRLKRINLFRGVTKERACQICGKNKNVYKCKGNCFGLYHIECDKKVRNKVISRLGEEQYSDSDSDEEIIKKKGKRRNSSTNSDKSTKSDVKIEEKTEIIDEKIEKNEEKVEIKSENEEETLKNDVEITKNREEIEEIIGIVINKTSINDKTKENISVENEDNTESSKDDPIVLQVEIPVDIDNNQKFVSSIMSEILDNVFDKEETKSVETSKTISLSMAEQIDLKMQEIMKNLITETKYTDSTSDEECAENTEKIANFEEYAHLPFYDEEIPENKQKTVRKTFIKHVTADGIFDVIEEQETTNEETFRCAYCSIGIKPPCFICNQEVAKSGDRKRHRCFTHQCGKYYHSECLKDWPQTKWNVSSKTKKIENETLCCPYHNCHTCISDNPRGPLSRYKNEQLAKCIRCPTTYHSSTFCIPAGTEILSSYQLICPKHLAEEDEDLSSPSSRKSTGKVPKNKIMPHVNASWCFICSTGGSLICCETCPSAFHVECLKLVPPEGRYLCEECESGRLPLYDEIVWVKLGAYRWWPAQILFPADVPPNVACIPHTNGEFVVRFFGSHDHYWVNRGRVFLFQEGDTGHASSKKSAVDGLFVKAIHEATKAHKIFVEDRANRLAEARNGMRPPPYIKIKVNRPVGNVRTNDADTSNTTPCDCDPNWDQPCGPDSDCLNRILMTECNPMVCAAGSRCCNQSFEKRLYSPVMPFKTSGRGWGLKTLSAVKKGSFIIEYVGELITEKEYRRRMKRKHEQKDENYYFLTIDKDRMIDAGPKGNVARFMNHSCSPNCETQKWTVNGDTRVGLFAIRDIPANAELTFNYNLECIGEEKKECRCGAQNCSGFIGVKAKQDDPGKKRKSLPVKAKKKKPPIETKTEIISCFVCGEPDAIQPCEREACNKFYHLNCVGLEDFQEGKWYCPWHSCNVCTKRTTRCCYMCINSYCPIHSEKNIRYDRVKGFVCTTHDIKEEEDTKEDVEDSSKTKDKLKKLKKPIRNSMDIRSSTDSSKNTDEIPENPETDTTEEMEDKSSKDDINSDISSDNNKEKKQKVVNKKSLKKDQKLNEEKDQKTNGNSSKIINDKKEDSSDEDSKIESGKTDKKHEENNVKKKEVAKTIKDFKNGAFESSKLKSKEVDGKEKPKIEENKKEKPKIQEPINNLTNSIKKRKSRLSLKKSVESSDYSSNSSSNSSQDELSDDEKPLVTLKKIKLMNESKKTEKIDRDIEEKKEMKKELEELIKLNSVQETKTLRSGRSLSQEKKSSNTKLIEKYSTKNKKRSLSLTDVDSSSSSETDSVMSPKNTSNINKKKSAKKIKLSEDIPKEPKILRSSMINSLVQEEKERINMLEDIELQIPSTRLCKEVKKYVNKTLKPKTSTPKPEEKEKKKNNSKTEDLDETPKKDLPDSPKKTKKFNLSLKKLDPSPKKDKFENPKPGTRRSERNLKQGDTTDEEIVEIESSDEEIDKTDKRKSLRSHKLEDSDDNIDYEDEIDNIKDDKNEDTVKRPRGRPRKYPKCSVEDLIPNIFPKKKGRPRKYPLVEPPPKMSEKVTTTTEMYKLKLNDQIPKNPFDNHIKEVKLTANVPERHLRVVLRKTEIETKIENKFIKMQNDIERDLPIRKRSKLRYEAQL